MQPSPKKHLKKREIRQNNKKRPYLLSGTQKNKRQHDENNQQKILSTLTAKSKALKSGARPKILDHSLIHSSSK